MNYVAAKRKLWLELVIMWPFVLIGRIIGFFKPLKTNHEIFFILPNMDIGGAPQVNLDLIACMKHKNPLVIFTKKGLNNLFEEHYRKLDVKIIDISGWIDNKFFHYVNFIFRGIVSSWISKQKKTVAFGGECIFFYKIVPHLSADILTVDLCHLPTWLNYTKAFAPYIDIRVFSTKYLLRRTEAEYTSTSVPTEYLNRLTFVESAIDIGEQQQNDGKELQVYSIGRGAAQKRVHLAAAIAKKCFEESLPVHFNFVGDVSSVIDVNDFPFCTFHGSIKDQGKMAQLYQQADVLLMTSKNEGLPIVVMQMLAMGKIIITTAVDALPDYIHHGKTGYLILATDEHDIIHEGTSLVKLIVEDPAKMKSVGVAARAMAVEKFSRESFCEAWGGIFGFL